MVYIHINQYRLLFAKGVVFSEKSFFGFACSIVFINNATYEYRSCFGANE